MQLTCATTQSPSANMSPTVKTMPVGIVPMTDRNISRDFGQRDDAPRPVRTGLPELALVGEERDGCFDIPVGEQSEEPSSDLFVLFDSQALARRNFDGHSMTDESEPVGPAARLAALAYRGPDEHEEMGHRRAGRARARSRRHSRGVGRAVGLPELLVQLRRPRCRSGGSTRRRTCRHGEHRHRHRRHTSQRKLESLHFVS